MAKASVFNTIGPVTGPAASATLANITVAAAQAAGWQNGTWFYWTVDAFIDGTATPATDDDNVKILVNGALLSRVSINGNGNAAAPMAVYEGNAQWNGVNLPIQVEANAAGTGTAIYHATVSAVAIDTTDDLPA
jgi:hypothetical protein